MSFVSTFFSSFSQIIRVVTRTSSLLAIALSIVLSSSVQAEQSQNPAVDNSAQPSPQQLKQQFMMIQQQLSQIQQQTIANNPELAQKYDEFESLFTQKAKAAGHTPEKDMDRLMAIQQQIQSPDLAESERQQMAQEFQQLRQSLMVARKEIMQQPEMNSKQTKLQEETISAMKEQSPKAEKLMQQMDMLRAQFSQNQ